MVASAPGFAASALEPGAVFHGRYRIVRCLKAGGMGAVYEVVDHLTASSRALKVLLPGAVADVELHTRFAREARVTGAIDSDHVVRVSDSGVDEATRSPFLVMELLRGEDLADVLGRRTRLPADEVVTYMTQAARALDKTHAAGVVHRDLKPPNLFLTQRDDGSPCIKILDFGIAKVVAQTQAQSTRAIGTPLFMAPEQIRGEGAIGAAADIYALAHVAYALLVGEAYWKEESNATDSIHGLLMKIAGGAVEPASSRARRRACTTLPPAFDAWFDRATAPDPAQRYERATVAISAMADALASPVAGPATAPMAPIAPMAPAPPYAATTLPAGAVPFPTQVAAPPAAPPAPRPAPTSRTLVVALGAVGVLLVVSAVLATLFLSGGGRSVSSSCIAGAACTALDVGDPAHVDAQAIYGQVEKAARASESSAALVYIIVTGAGRNGAVDLTRGGSIMYQFAAATTVLAATVRGGTITVMRGSGAAVHAPIPAPTCSAKAAWKAAVAAGLSPSLVTSMVYQREATASNAPTWSISANLKVFQVSGATCTIRTPR